MGRRKKETPYPPPPPSPPPPLLPPLPYEPRSPHRRGRYQPPTFWKGMSNSVWILWTFSFGILSWISFFYAGLRTGNSRWVSWGFIYLIPFLMIVLLGEVLPFMAVLGAMLAFPMGLVSMIHALIIRGEYLERLDAVEREQLLQPLMKEDTEPQTPAPEKKPVTDAPAQPVDVNNDDPEAIARLPGFDEVLATKVILIREMTGYFESLEDFGRALSLAPEDLERIRPYVKVLPPDPEKPHPIFGPHDSEYS